MIYSNLEAESGFLKNQVAFLTIQLMDERNKNQIWDLMRKSIEENPSLNTAWTDFLMILKLVNPELVDKFNAALKTLPI